MKLLNTNLLANVTSGAYDQNKTVIRGNVHQKTIGGAQYLGPALNKWIDVITDANITPASVFVTANGRLFVTSTEVGSTVGVALYDVDFVTGAAVYVGKITMHAADVAATTHTIRAFKVIDTGTTGWKLFWITSGSVAINGGVHMANKVDKADFTGLGTDFPYATGNDQKATYFLQDPANIGVGQLNIASAGAILEAATNRLYVHNGIAATHQYYVYDTLTAPTYTTSSVSVSVATPGVVTHTAHPFAVNTPVTFTAGTVPTGLVVGNTYFVRNPAANTYELSLTTGGVSINTTGSPSAGAFIGRAAGTCGSNFLFKTGNLPALTGTLILLDSEDYATPQHTTNAGFPCAFFGTTSQIYLGKLSELTTGATTWPSLVTANNNGDNSTISQSSRAYAWSQTLDRVVENTTGSLRLILKQVVNSTSDRIFGRTNILTLEGGATAAVYLGANTETNIVAMNMQNGWLFMASNATGQRGIISADLRSDSLFGYSYLISPVLTTGNVILKALGRIRALDNQTDGMTLEYRTSGFGSESGGWTGLTPFAEYNVPVASQIQFRIQFDTFSREGKGLHAQLQELLVGVQGLSEISDNWEFSDDFSDNTSPSRVAFRLKQTYNVSVPTLYFRARDLTDSLLTTKNTSADAAQFQYSTNNGITWLPLGTIPNTVGTLIRFTFLSPPGVDIRPSIQEI